jgi:hypothetical protein
MDYFLKIFFTVLIFVSGNIFDNIPLEVVQFIMEGVLYWLDGEGLIVSPTYLCV